jgi:hypothetical protein
VSSWKLSCTLSRGRAFTIHCLTPAGDTSFTIHCLTPTSHLCSLPDTDEPIVLAVHDSLPDTDLCTLERGKEPPKGYAD